MLLINICYDFLFTVLCSSSKQPLDYFFIKSLNHTWWNYCLISLIFFFFYKVGFDYFILIFLFLSIAPRTSIVYANLTPPALLIGYNAIHPFLFYLAVTLTFINYTHWDFFFLIKKKYPLCFIIVALFLGGLWGSGNSAWGFFWVNDSIELILFCVGVYSVICLHRGRFGKLYLESYITLTLLITWVLLLRWGFIFTRHSFINSAKVINIFRIFYLFILNNNYLLLPHFILYFFSYYILMYILIYKILVFFNSRTRIYLLQNTHIILTVVVLSWVKFSEYNLSVVVNSKQLIYNFFFISSNQISNTVASVDTFMIWKKFIVSLPTLFIYSCKKIISQFKLFVAWPKFIFIIILITSIWKI